MSVITMGEHHCIIGVFRKGEHSRTYIIAFLALDLAELLYIFSQNIAKQASEFSNSSNENFLV